MMMQSGKKNGLNGMLALLCASGVLLSGCLNDSGERDGSLAADEARLVIQTTVRDANASGLAKSSAITLDRLIITLRSSIATDTVRRDTVLADTGAFLSSSASDQQFTRAFAVKALRSWTVVVKTLDVNDSVVHYDSVPVPSMLLGQTRTVNLQLGSRYAMYEARYTLPSRLYPTDVPEAQRVYQKVFFSRLVLSVDGTVVRDSATTGVQAAGARYVAAGTDLRGATGRFFFKPSESAPDTITHVQTYDYVRTGTRVFDIKAYGYLEGDTLGIAPRLLFQGTREAVVAADGTIPQEPMVLQWKGPTAAPSDSVTAGHPDWTGVGLSVFIGKTNTITQEIEIPDGVGF